MDTGLTLINIAFAIWLAYGASLAVRAILAARRDAAAVRSLPLPPSPPAMKRWLSKEVDQDAEGIVEELDAAASELATAATGIRPDGEYVEHSEHGDEADPHTIRRREHQVVKNAAFGLARAVLVAVAAANAREPRAIPPDQQAPAHPGAGLSRRAGLL